MLASVLALALGGQACWDLYDGAMRHRAAAAHPAYVQYDENTALHIDGYPIVSATATVRYRSDGLARVEDSRFVDYSWVTDHVEPGPPELGPYGKNRSAWLPMDEPGLPSVIAEVRKHGAAACTNLGLEQLHGHLAYHLKITPFDASRPSLKALWIDADTAEIWKVVVSGRLFVIDGPQENSPVVDFEVELAAEGSYVMVQHVTWHYRMPIYSQYSNYFGEYYLSNFHYPNALPPVTFALNNHAVI
ncbi:MAG: hypothetical protein M3R30_10685 [Candidatus Eremiobacteraeota bacterium]|nr:hypothetical protein [Candidatus Eremiobacteraeota bacterium]